MPESDSPGTSLATLYQEMILDHYRRPRNRAPLPDASITVERNNPLCGDLIQLSLAFDGEIVRAAVWRGQGCSISSASASMMTQAIAGRTFGHARTIAARFGAMLSGDRAAADDELLGDLRALSAVARYPMRIKCALLPWSALEEGMLGKRGVGDGG
ncbi:MAG: SUF system NifU family Fe-S cluster assembly protein [Anaerolineae bacterium]|nr:SUF system NifU family Fe-S cluster assembly protein [Gemmatimonadaceae bacterium]